jgi:hypothetical protein
MMGIAALNPSHELPLERARLKPLIWAGCRVPFVKIFPFLPDANHFTYCRRLVPLEGRIAIVTDAGRDAVDADGALTNALEADGKDVWS